MKKALAIIVSLLFVLSITALSFAAEKAATTPGHVDTKATEAAKVEKKAPVKVKMVTGEVVAADAKAKTITVKGKKGDVVIAVDDKILTEIKAGDKVTAKYTETDGKMTAKSVKKAVAKKKVEPAKEETKTEPAKPAEKK
jgi:Cu/Ag efflux protein CusF